MRYNGMASLEDTPISGPLPLHDSTKMSWKPRYLHKDGLMPCRRP